MQHVRGGTSVSPQLSSLKYAWVAQFGIATNTLEMGKSRTVCLLIRGKGKDKSPDRLRKRTLLSVMWTSPIRTIIGPPVADRLRKCDHAIG